jgi:hypothetical protein
MSDYKIFSLIFLVLILWDAIGDGLRAKGKQIPHHILETVSVALWLFITVIIARGWLVWDDTQIIMYITLRIAIFDVIFNIIKGNKWSYVGKSSIYGIVLSWFTNLEKVKEPGFLIWVIRVLALIWWIAWFVTNGGR